MELQLQLRQLRIPLEGTLDLSTIVFLPVSVSDGIISNDEDKGAQIYLPLVLKVYLPREVLHRAWVAENAESHSFDNLGD